MTTRSEAMQGERNHRHRLTRDQVIEILKCKVGGGALKLCAARLGISRYHAANIRAGYRWRHVRDELAGKKPVRVTDGLDNRCDPA